MDKKTLMSHRGAVGTHPELSARALGQGSTCRTDGVREPPGLDPWEEGGCARQRKDGAGPRRTSPPPAALPVYRNFQVLEGIWLPVTTATLLVRHTA